MRDQSIPLWDEPDSVRCGACSFVLVSGTPWIEGRVHAVNGRRDCPPDVTRSLTKCGRCAGSVVPAQGGWRHTDPSDKCTAVTPEDVSMCTFCAKPIHWYAPAERWRHNATYDQCCEPAGAGVCSRCGNEAEPDNESGHSEGPVCHATPAGTHSTQPTVTSMSAE